MRATAVEPRFSPEQQQLLSLFEKWKTAMACLDSAFEGLNPLAEMGPALEAMKQVRSVLPFRLFFLTRWTDGRGQERV
jgi:hypothetical protein